MFILGICGGVASGKSSIARVFTQWGAIVLDADRAGHDVLTEPAVIDQLCKRWGEEILQADGSIQRSAVAAKVFGEQASAASNRQFLNQLMHPRIRAKLETQLTSLEPTTKLVVLDAALLFETGWNSLCNGVLFVDVPVELRWNRARSRGWTKAMFEDREAAQLPVDEKRRRSTWIIDNATTPAEATEQVRKLYAELTTH